MRKINLVSKSVYGKEMLYPNCEHSRVLCEIMKSKTVPEHQVNLIRELGYAVHINGGKELILEAIV